MGARCSTSCDTWAGSTRAVGAACSARRPFQPLHAPAIRPPPAAGQGSEAPAPPHPHAHPRTRPPSTPCPSPASWTRATRPRATSRASTRSAPRCSTKRLVSAAGRPAGWLRLGAGEEEGARGAACRASTRDHRGMPGAALAGSTPGPLPRPPTASAPSPTAHALQTTSTRGATPTASGATLRGRPGCACRASTGSTGAGRGGGGGGAGADCAPPPAARFSSRRSLSSHTLGGRIPKSTTPRRLDISGLPAHSASLPLRTQLSLRAHPGVRARHQNHRHRGHRGRGPGRARGGAPRHREVRAGPPARTCGGAGGAGRTSAAAWTPTRSCLLPIPFTPRLHALALLLCRPHPHPLQLPDPDPAPRLLPR